MEKTMPNTTILSKMNRTDSFSCSHHSFLPDQRRCTVLAVMAQLCIPEGSTHTQDLKPQPLKLTHTLSLSHPCCWLWTRTHTKKVASLESSPAPFPAPSPAPSGTSSSPRCSSFFHPLRLGEAALLRHQRRRAGERLRRVYPMGSPTYSCTQIRLILCGIMWDIRGFSFQNGLR